MKKLFASLSIAALICTYCACGEQRQNTTTSPDSTNMMDNTQDRTGKPDTMLPSQDRLPTPDSTSPRDSM